MSEWMLWGRFGGAIQLGSAPPPRLYLIPVSSSIETEGPLALQLGHRNRDHRTLDGFTRALERAVSCESDGVIFPSAFLTSPLRHEVLTRCQNRKLRVVHQVTTDSLTSDGASDRLDELLRRLDAGDALNLVFGRNSKPKETLLARLTRWPEQVYFTYSARKSDSTLELLHSLQPFVRERLFFHFPFHLDFGDGHLSCAQVYDLTEKIRERVPGVTVRPMLGTEMFDPRVDPDLELEPLHEPSIESRSRGGADHLERVPVHVSIIIPSYNNRDYLVNTVQHLARQNYPAANFEVVVVDDGSSDGTREAIERSIAPHKDKFNFKYIYSPRAKPRKMGDANYRAGISRNLGAKHATGRIFCFLDSDILTPPHFVADLVEKHKKYDVIQCKRLNLVREKSDDVIRYEEIDPEKDTFTTEDGYWERFYALTDWPKAPFFWKYTCTYGLSVPAQLFKRVGWIRRGFVFYGFEDVEFGYRLARVGARFHLNDMVTYHLFHRNERSEFHNSDYLRQSLLAKTAQIFFLNLLEPDIYMHFRGLMKEQLPIGGLITYLLKMFGFASLANRLTDVTRKITLNPRVRKHLWKIRIPFLAVWNWRVSLWHQWNRIKSSAMMTTKPALWLRSQSWRVRVAAGRFSEKAQLWRIPLASKWVWSQKWRVEVPLRRMANVLQLWRIGIWWQRLSGQFWRIPAAMQNISASLQLWRVRVFFQYIASQGWRIRVLLQRIKPSFWRIRVLFDRIRSQLWHISMIRHRVILSFFHFRMLLEKGLRTVLWTLFQVTYPIRKVYYFARYQVEKRALRKRDQSREHT